MFLNFNNFKRSRKAQWHFMIKLITNRNTASKITCQTVKLPGNCISATRERIKLCTSSVRNCLKFSHLFEFIFNFSACIFNSFLIINHVYFRLYQGVACDKLWKKYFVPVNCCRDFFHLVSIFYTSMDW